MWWKRLLCRFGWHSWTEWDTPRWTTNDRGGFTGRGVQYRMCDICKKQQRHIV